MYPYDNYGGVPPITPGYNYNVPNYSISRPTNPNTNKIYVSSIDEVKAKALPAGSDYIFLDNDNPILYQKIVSPNGQFEVKAFTISPYTPEEKPKAESSIDLSGYVKTTDLDAIKAELATLKTKLEAVNGTTRTEGTN